MGRGKLSDVEISVPAGKNEESLDPNGKDNDANEPSSSSNSPGNIEISDTNIVDFNLCPIIEDDVSRISLVGNLNSMCRMRGMFSGRNQLSVCIFKTSMILST